MLAKGIPPNTIVTRMGGDAEISRHTLKRHVGRCLETTFYELRKQNKINQAGDVANHLNLWLDEAAELYDAAKDVLLVDGELNLNPRAWEISVVYEDHNDLIEGTNQPKLKTATLSKLLARIESAGYEPKHSYIKAEDARKTIRECLSSAESLLDKHAKITGAYMKDKDNNTNELEDLRKVIQNVALKMGTSYERELASFIEMHGHRLRPDLRGMLLKESQDTLTPLGTGRGEGFAPLPSPAQLTGSMAKQPENTDQESIPKKLGENNVTDHSGS